MRAQPTLNKIVIQPPAPLLSIFFISHLFRSERIISLGAVVIVTSSFLLSFSHSDPFCANSKSSPRYLDSLLLLFVLNKLVPSQWALVVAQLAPKDWGSNLVIANFYGRVNICQLYRNDASKRKEAGNGALRYITIELLCLNGCSESF